MIRTLDNPGWMIKVGLEDTTMRLTDDAPFTMERSDTDWIHVNVDGRVLDAACGVNNLEEALELVLMRLGCETT